MTFVVPYVPKKDIGEGHPHELVDQWLESKPFEIDGRSPVALAYVFPKSYENFETEDEGGYFPGVVVVIEHRRRGNRSTRS